MFFRRNNNIFHIPIDAYQRTCLYIIITPIFYQIFNSCTRLRIKLNLIKNNKRISMI